MTKQATAEELRESVERFVYNFECDESCQCCMNNKAQFDELAGYAKASEASEISFDEQAAEAAIRNDDNPFDLSNDVETFLSGARWQFERDKAAIEQAIAHDRQPYPTAWAYEQACKTIDSLREKLAESERKLKLEEFGGKVNKGLLDSCEDEIEKLQAENEYMSMRHERNTKEFEKLNNQIDSLKRELHHLKEQDGRKYEAR